MDKGDCVPLWYYTNKGLDNTLSTYNSTDNDALTLLRHPDSSTLGYQFDPSIGWNIVVSRFHLIDGF